MELIVNKTNNLEGNVTVPGSKSQTVRGLIIALMAKGRSILHNALDSDDTNCAIRVCEDLGAKITKNGNDIIIENNGSPTSISNKLNSGNSYLFKAARWICSTSLPSQPGARILTW